MKRIPPNHIARRVPALLLVVPPLTPAPLSTIPFLIVPFVTVDLPAASIRPPGLRPLLLAHLLLLHLLPLFPLFLLFLILRLLYKLLSSRCTSRIISLFLLLLLFLGSDKFLLYAPHLVVQVNLSHRDWAGARTRQRAETWMNGKLRCCGCVVTINHGLSCRGRATGTVTSSGLRFWFGCGLQKISDQLHIPLFIKFAIE